MKKFAKTLLSLILLITIVINSFFVYASTASISSNNVLESPPINYNRRVAVISFDPIIGGNTLLTEYKGWNDPEELTDSYVDFLNDRLKDYNYEIVNYKTINEFPIKDDGFVYDAANYLNCLNNNSNCHQPDGVNYNLIFDDNDVCEQQANNEIDEVWLFGGPYFGYYESRLAGPSGFVYEYNSTPLVRNDCSKSMPIMGFNYERGLTEMIHSFGHRAEASMTRVYGGWEQNRLYTNWDMFGMNAFQSPNYNFSGCGSIHYPPNGESDYNYSNLDYIDTYCAEFLKYPNISINKRKTINCEEWGCTELGYLKWWMNRIPNVSNYEMLGEDGHDLNWWNYIIDPNRILYEENSNLAFSANSITCSSEYVSGWCKNLVDGYFATCNEGEWATKGTPTGWSNFEWDEPVTINQIKIYDRACSEQVLYGKVIIYPTSHNMTDGLGYIEYPFGPLDNSGFIPAKINVPNIEVNKVSVKILNSTGGANVGFGEVVIN